MPTKRIFIPDDVEPSFKKEGKNVHLLQYTNASTQENFDAFLTHNALVYILCGLKQIKVAHSDYHISSGELFLIPQGEYVMSEYIAGEQGFRSMMLFFDKKTAQYLLEQLHGYIPDHFSVAKNASKEVVKIIPHNPKIEALFYSLESYSQNSSPFVCEIIRLKFLELIFLLMDSPYRNVILSFLMDAARSENPDLPSILEKHLYTSLSLEEIAKMSGRSLSAFKREFMKLYKESPALWLRKKKLQRAAFLLETSNKTIEEVGESSGFVSNTHFSRLFKQHYSVTPSEYRSKRIKS